MEGEGDESAAADGPRKRPLTEELAQEMSDWLSSGAPGADWVPVPIRRRRDESYRDFFDRVIAEGERLRAERDVVIDPER